MPKIVVFYMYMKNMRLYRSRKDKIIAGVCGGLGKYFEIDSIIPRIIFIVLTIAGNGAGIIIYLLMYLMVPVETNGPEVINIDNNIGIKKNDARFIFGLILLLFGLIFLAKQFIPGISFLFQWSFLAPIMLIMFGLILLFKKNN